MKRIKARIYSTFSHIKRGDNGLLKSHFFTLHRDIICAFYVVFKKKRKKKEK